MGCFLPQALDWIQETGEYYLSTHTSTGDTTEETQELLKEYGEFRVPAKVGGVPEPSPHPPALPGLARFTLQKGEQPLYPEVLTTGRVGGSPLMPECPENRSLWMEHRCEGGQLVCTVLTNIPLRAPGLDSAVFFRTQ